MLEAAPQEKDPLEMPLTIIMAIISVTTALLLWRASLVGSAAGGLDQHGIIDTIRAGSADLQDIGALYQEARLATTYYARQAGIQVLNEAAEALPLEGQEDLATAVQSEAQWLSAVVEGFGSVTPLCQDPSYLQADGSLDLDRRLAEIRAENPDLRDLEPEDSFRQADLAYKHVGLLYLAAIPLGIALVSCTVAQLIERKLRYAFLGLSVVIFGLTLAHLALVETGVLL